VGEITADNNISSNGSVATAEKKKMHQFTKCDHEALVEIFKQIGQKDLCPSRPSPASASG
jgi:hypothetical protein